MRKIKVVVLLVRQLEHGFTKNAKVSPNLTVAHVGLCMHVPIILCTFSMIQIVHILICFAQVIVAVICMGIALVVCESGGRPPKEATLERKETPAEKDETPVRMAYSAVKDNDAYCSNSCDQGSRVCFMLCDSDLKTYTCKIGCTYTEYLCYVSCAIPS